MHKAVVCCLLILILLPGCAKEQGKSDPQLLNFMGADAGEGEMAAMRVAQSPMNTESSGKDSSKLNFDETKIIKTANIEFQVDDIAESKKRIQELVEAEKGYVANQEESNNRARIQVVFTIRVPSDGFDRLVERMLGEGVYVGRLNIERKDVTEEYLDLKARTETQKALESRYRDILRKAKTVEEILKVESVLGQLREEIEAREGRMKYLSHQAEFSTIHALVYQTIPYKAPPRAREEGFVGRLATSLVDGWFGLMDFVIALISIWPLLIILGVLAVFIVRWRKRRNRRRDADTGKASASKV